MADVISGVEKARLSAMLSQAQIARELAVTQGHYSKVVSAKVPLTAKLAARMEAWLTASGAAPIEDGAAQRIRELAASIRSECMELMHLVGLSDPAAPVARTERPSPTEIG